MKFVLLLSRLHFCWNEINRNSLETHMKTDSKSIISIWANWIAHEYRKMVQNACNGYVGNSKKEQTSYNRQVASTKCKIFCGNLIFMLEFMAQWPFLPWPTPKRGQKPEKSQPSIKIWLFRNVSIINFRIHLVQSIIWSPNDRVNGGF